MSDSELKDHESLLQIDEHALDRECVRLPRDFMRHAYQAAERRRDLEELKTELEVLEADLARKIRDMPNSFGIEKATNDAVRETVVVQKDHKHLTQQVIDAKHALDIAQAVVSALEHKKDALGHLVKLHGMGYFSDVKVSKEDKETVDRIRAKRQQRRD